RLALEADVPGLFEDGADALVRDVAVAGELVREGAHVAGALDVVLAAQRVHADAGPAEVTGRHRQVRHAHDHGRALAVLRDAKAVVDRGVAAGCVEAGRGAHIGRRYASNRLYRFGRVALLSDE